MSLNTADKPLLKHDAVIPPIYVDKKELNSLLLECVKAGVSDIYINSGRPVLAEVWGKMHRITKRPIGQQEAMVLVDMLLEPALRNKVISGHPQPSAYTFVDPYKVNDDGSELKHRFRINVSRTRYKSEYGIQGVIRVLQSDPPDVEWEDELDDFRYVPGKLAVPRRLYEGMLATDGLTLISGSTGSGKTTLFAALLKYTALWEDSPIKGNILTGEHPVEFVFDRVLSPHSEILQHAIGEDVPSFAEYVRDLMRRHPALGVIGEIRDRETIGAALELSLTGHPAWGTVHANDTPAMLPRLLSLFPHADRPSVQANLIESTRMLINQSLARTVDGKRTAIRSYLQITPKIRSVLEKCKGQEELGMAIREALFKYGVTKTAAAKEAYSRGLIDEREVSRITAGEEQYV